MTKQNGSRRWRMNATLLALMVALAIPSFALAEATAEQPATSASAATPSDATTSATVPKQNFGRSGQKGKLGGYGVDTSTLTEEQKVAYQSALSLYEQVEDKVLADLVTASVVTQADADSYIALRAAQQSLAELDQSGWSADQYKAYYEAKQKTGDERKAAMQALVDAGQLTQAQADALSADQSDLWSKISQNASTNSAIQTALGTMRQARQTLNSALREAGIAGLGRGNDFGGFGMGKGSGRGQQNDDADGPQDNENNQSGKMEGQQSGRGNHR